MASKPKAIVRQQPTSIDSLMQVAVKEGNLTPEGLNLLFDLKMKINAEEARMAFNEALRAFQAKCPPIRKTKRVGGSSGFGYKYAPFGVIKGTIQPTLDECGLSLRYDSITKDDHVKTTCIVTHILGHSEASSFSVVIDKSGKMNDAQKVASALSFSMRYATILGLGLTAIDDNDAKSLDVKDLDPKTKNAYLSLLKKAPKEVKERYQKFEENAGGLDNADDDKVKGWISALEKKLGVEGGKKL